MLWLTLRQLKNGNSGTRQKAARQLWREPDPRALDALAEAALKDRELEVRQLAASALGRLNIPEKFDPLIQVLQDKEPEVVKAALSGFRRSTEEKAIRALIGLLHHPNFSVRVAAAQTIDTIRWAPKDREERIWFQVAKGWYDKAAAAGPEAIPPLELTISTGHISAAVRAVEALGRIPDARVIELLREAIESPEAAVRIAAADALGKLGGSEAVETLTKALRSPHGQLRVAAVQALGILRAVEATEAICKMLRDPEWDVRQEAAVALGRLGNAEAWEPLAATLQDTDADVREAAAVALGKIGDRRAVAPLILALKDESSSVRRIASAGLARIDPDWVSLPETRGAAEQLKLAIQDAEPAIRFFVAQLLVNMGELAPEALAGLTSEDPLASPAVKRKRVATHLFIAMLEDPDRDIRQAAAEALGHLGGDRARQALTRTANDMDGDVAASIRMALQALGPETRS